MEKEWIEIKKTIDIEDFMEKVYGFHDCCIKEIYYSSGTFVDNNKSMGYTKDKNSANIIIQSQLCEAFEMLFENIKRININTDDRYFGDIFDATFEIRDGLFYWSNFGGWNKEELEVTPYTSYIISEKVSYKIRRDIDNSTIDYNAKVKRGAPKTIIT